MVRKKRVVKKTSRRRAARKTVGGAGARQGCAAVLTIAEQCGTQRDKETQGVAVGDALPPLRPGAATAARRKGVRASAALCRALAAVGHETRMKIMVKLLSGPATYRAVQRVTKAPPGPLYHHINQLRLAGLILPKQRDLYELTRGGRNLVLGVSVLEPLIKDRRRRPMGAP